MATLLSSPTLYRVYSKFIQGFQDNTILETCTHLTSNDAVFYVRQLMNLTIHAKLVTWILQGLAKTIVEIARYHGHSHLADHFQVDYGCYPVSRSLRFSGF
jgi:hypothetical protein